MRLSRISFLPCFAPVLTLLCIQDLYVNLHPTYCRYNYPAPSVYVSILKSRVPNVLCTPKRTLFHSPSLSHHVFHLSFPVPCSQPAGCRWCCDTCLRRVLIRVDFSLVPRPPQPPALAAARIAEDRGRP